MDKDAGQIFRELKDDITTYAELKFDLFKLSAYEGVGKVAGLLSYGLILMFLAFFALLFVFFSVGFFLGELFNSIGLGFACVALIYILLMILVIINKRWVQVKVVNEVIEALTTNDDKDGSDNKQKEDDSTGEVAVGEVIL